MNSAGMEKALAASLQKVESGEATLEEMLERTPELGPQLEPLVKLAAELRAMPEVRAPESLRGDGRPVFRVARAKAPVIRWPRLQLPALPSYGWASPAMRVAAAVAAVLLLGSGTVVASAGSLPSEPLYPVKLAVENLVLTLAPGSEARAEMEMQFATRRVQEVEAVAGREQERVNSIERALDLYEEGLDRALRKTEAGSPAIPDEDSAQLQEALKQNYDVLTNSAAKVENPRARMAIEAAAARTAIRAEERASSQKKNEDAGAASKANPAGKEQSGAAKEKSQAPGVEATQTGRGQGSGPTVEPGGTPPAGQAESTQNRPSSPIGQVEGPRGGREVSLLPLLSGKTFRSPRIRAEVLAKTGTSNWLSLELPGF